MLSMQAGYLWWGEPSDLQVRVLAQRVNADGTLESPRVVASVRGDPRSVLRFHTCEAERAVLVAFTAGGAGGLTTTLARLGPGHTALWQSDQVGPLEGAFCTADAGAALFGPAFGSSPPRYLHVGCGAEICAPSDMGSFEKVQQGRRLRAVVPLGLEEVLLLEEEGELVGRIGPIGALEKAKPVRWLDLQGKGAAGRVHVIARRPGAAVFFQLTRFENKRLVPGGLYGLLVDRKGRARPLRLAK
jgi:hypothetical protein